MTLSEKIEMALKAAKPSQIVLWHPTREDETDGLPLVDTVRRDGHEAYFLYGWKSAEATEQKPRGVKRIKPGANVGNDE